MVKCCKSCGAHTGKGSANHTLDIASIIFISTYYHTERYHFVTCVYF